MKVAAHAHGKAGIEAAIRAGVDSIEHGTYGDAETIELFKEHGTYLVPTIIAGKTVAEMAKIPGALHPTVQAKAARIGPLIQDMFRRAYAGGVKIAFGTDSGVSNHGENAREFGYMVEAGMPADRGDSLGDAQRRRSARRRRSRRIDSARPLRRRHRGRRRSADRHHRASARHIRHERRQGRERLLEGSPEPLFLDRPHFLEKFPHLPHLLGVQPEVAITQRLLGPIAVRDRLLDELRHRRLRRGGYGAGVVVGSSVTVLITDVAVLSSRSGARPAVTPGPKI